MNTHRFSRFAAKARGQRHRPLGALFAGLGYGLMTLGVVSAPDDSPEAKGKAVVAEISGLWGEQKYVPLIERADEIMADKTIGNAWKAQVLGSVAQSYYRISMPQQAEATLRQIISDFPDAPSPHAHWAMGNLISALRDSGALEDAIAIQKQGLARYGNDDEAFSWASVRYTLARCYIDTGQHDAATAELQTIHTKYNEIDKVYAAKARASLINLYGQMGKKEEALRLMSEALRRDYSQLERGLPVIAQTQRTLATLALNDAELNTIVRETKLAIAKASLVKPQAADLLQAMLATVLFDHGKFDQALYEARILLGISSPQLAEQTANMMARAIKALDRNLARANQLLVFLSYGAAGEDKKMGTADDVTDPLKSMKTFKHTDASTDIASATQTLDDSWSARVKKAQIYRYYGLSSDALKELKTAFALCPMQKEPLQAITDVIVDVLVDVSGDLEIGNAFIAFQKYGAAGEDGKVGTNDDLGNPISQYID